MVPNSAGGSSRSCIPRVPAARRRGGSPWGQSCESAECNPLRDDRRSSRQVAAYRFGRERESRFLKFDNRCFSTMSRVEYSPFARPTLLPHCLERLVVAVRHWLVAKEQERVEASQRRADTGFTTIQKNSSMLLTTERLSPSPHCLERLAAVRHWSRSAEE